MDTLHTREVQFCAESSQDPKPLYAGSCLEAGSGIGSRTSSAASSSVLYPMFSCDIPKPILTWA